MVKGWITLDIDGTVTDSLYEVPKPVDAYLHSLVDRGWKIAFITGRTYSFASRPLKTLSFPYVLGLQNGADILYMPAKTKLFKTYLSSDILPAVEEACKGLKEDYLIYAGYDKGDFCYYRPDRFSSAFLAYLEVLKELATDPWIGVKTFDLEELKEFPLIKCFGTEQEMQKVSESLSKYPGIKTAVIRDPVKKDVFLNLITSQEATKGRAVWHICRQGEKLPVIAAGDDRNDIPMLEAADVKIAMENAPQEMLSLADIIAPSASKHGLIQALKQATEKYDR